jgi:stress response protein YsnF
MPYAANTRQLDRRIVVPLLQERAFLTKRKIVTGSVRIRTVTREHEELVNEFLTREKVEIERLPVRKLIDRAPEVRNEGDVLIIPVIEEVLVVERRLLLKEEIRVRRVRVTERHQASVKVRRQEVVFERKSATMPNARVDKPR